MLTRFAGSNFTYHIKVLGHSPIAYWPLWEPSGSAASELVGGLDGTYADVTLGETGIGDGNTCPAFDGSASVVDIYTAALAAAFSGAEGALALWLKVRDATFWTEGVLRHGVRISSDASNQIYIRKHTGNNEIRTWYEAGGTSNWTSHGGLSTLNWMHFALTWSKSTGASGEVKHYYAGSQVGATQTGLGTWANLPASTTTVVGAHTNVPALVWDGWIAHVALWDEAISSVAVADLAAV